MFYITPDIFFSGKVSFLCLILPCQCSAVMSWHAASIASRRDIWSKTFRLQVEEKLLNEVEKSGVNHSRIDVKPVCDCTGNGGMPHCSMWSHILTSSLSTSGTSLSCRFSKIAHFCRSALFCTRSAQRGPLLLYTVRSCDWTNLNTWVCFLRCESAVIYIFASRCFVLINKKDI